MHLSIDPYSLPLDVIEDSNRTKGTSLQKFRQVSARIFVTEETQRGVDEHNDALGDEAKRGKEDISELMAK